MGFFDRLFNRNLPPEEVEKIKEQQRLWKAERASKKALKRERRQANAAISAQMEESYKDFEAQRKRRKK